MIPETFFEIVILLFIFGGLFYVFRRETKVIARKVYTYFSTTENTQETRILYNGVLFFILSMLTDIVFWKIFFGICSCYLFWGFIKKVTGQTGIHFPNAWKIIITLIVCWAIIACVTSVVWGGVIENLLRLFLQSITTTNNTPHGFWRF